MCPLVLVTNVFRPSYGGNHPDIEGEFHSSTELAPITRFRRRVNTVMR